MPAAEASLRGLSIHGGGTRSRNSSSSPWCSTRQKGGTGMPSALAVVRIASLSRKCRAVESPIPGMRRCSRSAAAVSTS